MYTLVQMKLPKNDYTFINCIEIPIFAPLKVWFLKSDLSTQSKKTYYSLLLPYLLKICLPYSFTEGHWSACMKLSVWCRNIAIKGLQSMLHVHMHVNFLYFMESMSLFQCSEQPS